MKFNWPIFIMLIVSIFISCGLIFIVALEMKELWVRYLA